MMLQTQALIERQARTAAVGSRPLIRPARPADASGIAAVHRGAFGQTAEARLVEALRALHTDAHLISLVAVESTGERVVGHILFSPIAIVSGSRKVAALALAPMAVAPDRQNRGIGSSLVHRGLDACQQDGHAIVVVLGHPRFYPRFGFQSARRRGVRAPFSVRDETFLVLELVEGALEGVRGVVRYPEPFDAV